MYERTGLFKFILISYLFLLPASSFAESGYIEKQKKKGVHIFFIEDSMGVGSAKLKYENLKIVIKSSRRQSTIPATRHLGLKSGLMLLDLNGENNIVPIGVVYSHRLDKLFSNRYSKKLWMEGEFNVGLAGGEYEDNVNNSGEVSLWTAAGYVAYQHPLSKATYLKGKLGLLYESVDISRTVGRVNNSWSDYAFGLSIGLGGGFRITDWMLGEVEYTTVESDVNFLSFCLKFPLD